VATPPEVVALPLPGDPGVTRCALKRYAGTLPPYPNHMRTHCTHTFRTITSHYNWANGQVRTYWLRCKACGYTWKVLRDLNTGQELLHTTQRRVLTPEEVKFILTHPSSGVSKARELGVSHQAVSQVINGESHKSLWPDLPRRTPQPPAPPAAPTRSCRSCQHWWKGTCDLDIPEAGSASFATECSYFEE
jgi:hypothetical protein